MATALLPHAFVYSDLRGKDQDALLQVPVNRAIVCADGEIVDYGLHSHSVVLHSFADDLRNTHDGIVISMERMNRRLKSRIWP